MATGSRKIDNHPEGASVYPCVCAVVRKAGRILTRRYDEYLKLSGVKITQFSMLVNIARHPSITVSELAKLLVMDQTTVTRNLYILEKSCYIHRESHVKDRRVKEIRITDAGMSKINEARPLWEQAQLEMESVLGAQSVEDLLRTLLRIAP